MSIRRFSDQLLAGIFLSLIGSCKNSIKILYLESFQSQTQIALAECFSFLPFGYLYLITPCIDSMWRQMKKTPADRFFRTIKAGLSRAVEWFHRHICLRTWWNFTHSFSPPIAILTTWIFANKNLMRALGHKSDAERKTPWHTTPLSWIFACHFFALLLSQERVRNYFVNNARERVCTAGLNFHIIPSRNKFLMRSTSYGLNESFREYLRDACS